ncbi:TonB-dependent receptor domain-containing protein [Shewanella cyperi]|uniref:TonB-dependent receptor domain-containing protein n=1 Tax=Shewanella cyperi TaxID=2814292 RepID=UPI001A93ACE9|nr:TonB-dependent receptor [Shewanella cyperi]QSX39515.1 TonB-dependent receptor [Shewanella cyperi]
MQTNNTLAKAIRFALIGGAAIAATQTTTAFAAEEGVKVERIEVTGSRIKRTDMENATPVTVMSAEDMAKQGFTNIQDALESLSSTTGAMTTQSVHGFTPAASSISLRNAGASRTLTLINGKRLNQYPKPAGGTDNFVDTANLPMEAVARIEVLQSGASAVYGADAVGGVVNIILKKDFEGAAVKYRHGDTTEGGGASDRIALSLGASSDRSNVSTFMEFTDTEELKASEREVFGVHTDLVPYSPFAAYSSYGARIAGGPKGNSVAGSLPAAECTAQGFLWIPEKNLCGFDRSQWRDLAPESTRFISSTNYNYELNDNLSFVGRFDYAQASSTTRIEPMAIDNYTVNVAGDVITLGVDLDDSLTKSFDKATGLGGDFANAEDGDYYYVRRLHEFSNRAGETNTRNYFFTAGLEGVIADEYNWDASVNYGRTNLDIYSSGYASAGSMFAYLSEGEFGRSLLNPITAADVENIAYSPFERAQSTQKNIQANISGAAFDLPAGSVDFAFGAEWTKQDYETDTDSESKKGNILSRGGSSGQGDRSYWASYVEMRVPVTEELVVDTAVRYDRYSDFGGNLTPQIALEYRPMDELLVRATVGKVFRAPDMHRVYGDATKGFDTVIDFQKCEALGGTPGKPSADATTHTVCNELHIDTTTGANKDLNAEKGYTANIGAVWGGDSLNASIDVWQWKLDDMVSDISADKAAREYTTYADMITRDATGTITHVNAVAQNLAFQKVRGIDMTAGYGWDLDAMGELKLNFNGSYILLSEGQTDPTADIDDDLEDGGLPQYRANLLATWIFDDFETTLGAYHTARMHGVSYKSFKASAEKKGLEFDESAHEVASQTKWNLSTSYHATESITVKAGVVNLFNVGPNFDPTDTSWPHYPRSVYNARGREWFIEGEVKF